MAFDQEQRGIIRQSALAVGLAALLLGAVYLWLPRASFGLVDSMTVADRIAFALKWDLLLFLWLAGCVRTVASGRFRSVEDRKGSAYGEPGPAIAVRAAVLQNSLEQAVIAFGLHLALAALLRGPELALIPSLILLFLIGRIAFAARYSRGAVARAFGMSLTGASAIAGFAIALALVLAGR